MKNLSKITVSLLLTILFLLACIIALVMLFFGAWLHTYHVFTKEVVVAEVVMYPTQKDENGEYIEIELTPISNRSALTSLISPSGQDEEEIGETKKYKLYGDTVHVGGPIVKFHNELILFNFETIYKLARVYGFYQSDPKKEENRKITSSYDLNEGIDDTWWTLNNNEGVWPYNMFIDRVELKTPGEFGFKNGNKKKYEVRVGVSGFTWKFIERIEETQETTPNN